MEKTEKIKIMIVDDDKFLLDMYSKKFDSSGYETTVSLDAEDCLSRLKNGYSPDIFIFDLIMPKIDGISLFNTIIDEKLSPDSVNIILTNQGQQDDLRKVEELGVDGYIVKALFTPSKVVEKVAEIYSNKK